MTNETSHNVWLRNAVQAQQSLDHAMQTFYLACDKELATMAGYRALGLDPADAPRFGWLLPGSRPTNSTTVNTVNNSWTNAVLVILACVLLVAGVGAVAWVGSWTHATPSPVVEPAKRSLDVRWWVENGEVRTEVKEVK